jgi:hypothetical protein
MSEERKGSAMSANRQGRLAVAALVVLGLAVLFAGAPFVGSTYAQKGTIVNVTSDVEQAKAELKKLGPPTRAFALISRIIKPSVVSVVTKRKMKITPGQGNPFGEDWPFDVPNPFEGRRPNARSRAWARASSWTTRATS